MTTSIVPASLRPARFASEPATAPTNAPARPVRTLRKNLAVIVLVVLAITLELVVPLMPSGRFELLAASLGCLSFAIALFLLTLRYSTGYLVPPFIVLACGLQLFWIVLFPLLDFAPRVIYSEMPFDITDTPYTATWPLLLMPLAGLLSILIFRGILSAAPKLRAEPPPAPDRPEHMPAFLYVSAVLMLVVWISNFVNGGYILRVATVATGFAPFLAGRYADRYPNVRRFWFGAMAINLVIGVVGGGRLAAFMPVALFVGGAATRLTGQKRRRLLLVVAMTAIPMLYISARISWIRSHMGRGGIELFTAERAVAVASDIVAPASEAQTPDDLVASDGIGRFVVWPNLAVVTFSPDVVPYRGFDDFFAEAEAYSTIGALSGQTAEDFAESNFGQMVAAKYGFMIDATTAVNFGMLADGWSRGGPLVAMAYGLSISLFLLLLEELARWFRTRSYLGYLLVLCTVVRSPFQIPTDPIFYLARMTTLYVGLIVAIVLGASFASGFLRGPRK
jgi:hypothetical protein